MRVGELIDTLKGYDPEEVIVIAQPTHNYWGEVRIVDIDYVEHSIVGRDYMIYEEIQDAISNSDGYDEVLTILTY